MVRGYEVDFLDHIPDETLQVEVTCDHGPGTASWVLRMSAELALDLCADIINGLAERHYSSPRTLATAEAIEARRRGEG